MKRGTRVFVGLLFLLSFTFGCDGIFGGSGPNQDWPEHIQGYRVEFTVTDEGNAGIPAGDIIVYEFGASGQVEGTNPVTEKTYTPESYVYSGSGNTAQVTLYWDDGHDHSSVYDLVADDTIATGTYDYNVTSSIGDYFSAGTYEVLEGLEQADLDDSDSGGGDNSCEYANDGECDEPLLCAIGTDSTDC
jgi:hypothetical protein